MLRHIPFQISRNYHKPFLSLAFAAVALFLLFAAPHSTSASQVTLAWDPPGSEPDRVAGYKVYCGTSTRNYAFNYDAGKTNSYTISNLQAGNTYYFAATAYDAYGNESDFSAEISHVVAITNNPPVAQSGALATNQDTPAGGRLNATDQDGDTLTYSITTQGSKGTAVITGTTTGNYTFTPNAGVYGTDTFFFRVRDPGGLTSTAAVTVTISKVNHAPVAQSGALATNQDTPAGGRLNATDQDGDTLTYSITTQGSKGTAVITGTTTGNYTFTPNAGVYGTDTFFFRVRDPGGLTSTAAVTVTISKMNLAPVASNSAFTTFQDSPVSSRLTATDADGNALQYQIVVTPSMGAVYLNSLTGSFTYTPNPNMTGTDSFTFKANDGTVDSNVASVQLTVSAHIEIQLEAEQGNVAAPMTRVTDYNASGGSYIWVPNGQGSVSDPLEAVGQASYSFNVPVSGSYLVWGRVTSNGTSHNSFFVSMDQAYELTWHTALGPKNTWMWDQVSDSSASAPAVFYLEAGTHSLLIKQREDGSKLDSLMITSQPRWIPQTVYCDAENGAVDGWDVFDADPSGALISSVYEVESRESDVIELLGSGTYNGYRLRSKDFSDWANSTQLVIAWSMKYAESFVIYVDVQTSFGTRTLQYEPVSTDYLGEGRIVRLALGTEAKDGQWHTFVRDLQADLNQAQGRRVKILSVKSFSIRGSGKVDDVKLRQFL